MRIVDHACLFGKILEVKFERSQECRLEKCWAMFTELFQTQYLLLMEDGHIKGPAFLVATTKLILKYAS